MPERGRPGSLIYSGFDVLGKCLVRAVRSGFCCVSAGPGSSRLVNALATSPGPHQSMPMMIPVRLARIA